MYYYRDFLGSFASIRRLIGGRYLLRIYFGRNLLLSLTFRHVLLAYFVMADYSDNFHRCARCEFRK